MSNKISSSLTCTEIKSFFYCISVRIWTFLIFGGVTERQQKHALGRFRNSTIKSYYLLSTDYLPGTVLSTLQSSSVSHLTINPYINVLLSFVSQCGFIDFFLRKRNYTWHKILCQFQVYNVVISHSSTLWNDHHDKCGKGHHENCYSITDCIPYVIHYIPVIYLFYSWKFNLSFNLLDLFCPISYLTPFWERPVCSL